MERHDNLPLERKRDRRQLNSFSRRSAQPDLPPLFRLFIHGRRSRIADTTRGWYEEAFASFCRFAAAQDVDPGEPANLEGREARHLIEGWLNGLKDAGYADNTLNNRFRALRAFFNWAVEDEEVIEKSPMRRMQAPPTSKEIPEEFTEAELAAMLRLCPPNRWWGARDAAVILLACTAGLRREEISKADRYDVNDERGQLIVHGKGKKQRIAPVGDDLLGVLLRYDRFRSAREPALVQTAPHRGSHRLSPNGVYQVMHDLAVRVGIGGKVLGVHRGRHTFARQVLRTTGNLKLVQDLMGHSSIKITGDIYTRGMGGEHATEEFKKADPFGEWRL